ncbi:MAG: hypothetical protein KDK36_11820 [Leptospiraceae bacterium]|nr:hypothetical protein [Leptospiraceae bacterium]
MGDMKFGFLDGLLDGAIGGVLFDPIGILFHFDGDTGTLARIVGFSIFGILPQLQSKVTRKLTLNNKPEMFVNVTRSLPAIPRLRLPER